jgi:hypothetical protein
MRRGRKWLATRPTQGKGQSNNNKTNTRKRRRQLIWEEEERDQ